MPYSFCICGVDTAAPGVSSRRGGVNARLEDEVAPCELPPLAPFEDMAAVAVALLLLLLLSAAAPMCLNEDVKSGSTKWEV